VIVLSGAAVVLPDGVLTPGTVVIEGERIAEIQPGPPRTPDVIGHYIVPGFIDVHVHGVEGIDTCDPGQPIAALAARLPQYGVTAFCPTTAACGPETLRRVLAEVRHCRASADTPSARVLPAHLESNFINPDYRGAQPARCLRLPRPALHAWRARQGQRGADASPGGADPGDFDAADILHEIERAPHEVGIVTLAPELDGGLELLMWLTGRGHVVSLGHSGATYEQALAAMQAGATHATHLFNRMPPLAHRAPGLAGAVLQSDAVWAEVICDGVHVHPAMLRTAIGAKGASRVMAITDGTGASGLPEGSRARLGGQVITARDSAAFLADGTLAGSALTMDRAFRVLVEQVGVPLVDAAAMCATTPAQHLGLAGHGRLARAAAADVTVLDSSFSVLRTFVGGRVAFSRP
jgi:N-acetylglucosamine-6-phosphate deacetylase